MGKLCSLFALPSFQSKCIPVCKSVCFWKHAFLKNFTFRSFLIPFQIVIVTVNTLAPTLCSFTCQGKLHKSHLMSPIVFLKFRWLAQLEKGRSENKVVNPLRLPVWKIEKDSPKGELKLWDHQMFPYLS